jgi:hypothetical protein
VVPIRVRFTVSFNVKIDRAQENKFHALESCDVKKRAHVIEFRDIHANIVEWFLSDQHGREKHCLPVAGKEAKAVRGIWDDAVEEVDGANGHRRWKAARVMNGLNKIADGVVGWAMGLETVVSGFRKFEKKRFEAGASISFKRVHNPSFCQWNFRHHHRLQ